MANKRSFAANQNQHFLANCTGINLGNHEQTLKLSLK